MISYGLENKQSKILVCFHDQLDQCISSAKYLIKNISDQTLFKLTEKFPVVVSKNLEEMIAFAKEFYKVAVIVPTGIDILDSNVITVEINEDFQIVNLKDKVKDIFLHKADKIDLAKNVFYLDGHDQESFEKGLEWQNKKFSLGHGAFFYPINNEPIHNLDIDKIQQLIVPAAGLNWVKYLNKYGYNENTVVRFYDYSYLALDCMKEIVLNYNGNSYKDFIMQLGRKKFKFIGREWDYGFASMYHEEEPDNWLNIVNTVKFDFLHINILENIDIESLIDNIPGTFINFSNIFSYYLTSAFYSLQSRIDAEQRIINDLKKYDCYIGFITRAGNVYHTNPQLSGHINTFTKKEHLNLPTWYENN